MFKPSSTDIIWITGASSGIGKAVAEHYASRGHRIIISARREDKLNQLRDSLANPSQVAVLPFDLSAKLDFNELAERAASCFGKVDLLINNGGVGQFGSVLSTVDDVEHQIFDTNFFGNIALAKAIGRHMIQHGRGQIISIASIAANFGQRNLAAYSASKAAVKLYYESWKEEVLETGLDLKVISPGFINTDVTINGLRADGTKINRNSPAQEKGMSTEIFAQKLVKVSRSKKFHHYIGRKELMAIPFHLFAPSLFYKLLRRRYS